MAGNGRIICDAAGNVVTGYGNTALATTQPAILGAGHDYGATPKAQIPKVDAYGTQYVATANPAGNPAQVYTGQAVGATTTQYGGLTMLRQDAPTPAAFVPMIADGVGSLQVHAKSKQTFRAIAAGVTCAAGKSIFSMVYANTGTMILRLNEAIVYVPPSGSSTSGSLLGISGGSSSTYYPLICELRRISTASGGTAIIPVSSDSADSLTSGLSCATGATVGSTINTYHRQDAVVSTGTGLPWYGRYDPGNEKTFVMRPGEGFSITVISNGTINNANGSGTTTAVVDIELVFTQAPA